MKLYSMRQAAKMAEIAYSTLHYWLYTGEITLPQNKVGARWVYTEEEIKKLAKHNRDRKGVK